MKRSRILLVVIVIALVSMSCALSGGQATQPAPTEAVVQATQAPVATQAPEATAVPSGEVSSVEEVKKATIQIEAQGTFVDPQVGTVYNAAGRGPASSSIHPALPSPTTTSSPVLPCSKFGLAEKVSRATPRCSASRSAGTWQ